MEKIGHRARAVEFFERASLGSQEPAGMMFYNDQPADMILYQGLAKKKLGKQMEADSRFHKLVEYGEKHVQDNMRIEYFAVSLPDFMIFEEDLNIRNQAHCYYLMGLGNKGMGNLDVAKTSFEKALELDMSHMNCARYKRELKK